MERLRGFMRLPACKSLRLVQTRETETAACGSARWAGAPDGVAFMCEVEEGRTARTGAEYCAGLLRNERGRQLRRPLIFNYWLQGRLLQKRPAVREAWAVRASVEYLERNKRSA